MSPEQRAQIQRRLAAVAEERATALPKPILVPGKRVTNSGVTNSPGKGKAGRPRNAEPSAVALRMRFASIAGCDQATAENSVGVLG